MIRVKKEKPKKKLFSLDTYVIFSILSLIIFTVISQIIAIHYTMTLDTLTTCFFGFFGGEVVTCGLIKIFKIRDDSDNKDKENTNDISVG